MLSAFTVLEQLNKLYVELGQSEQEFKSHVVPACSAIFLHNLHPSRLNKRFNGEDNSQVALLLKMVDCFQDWWRPQQDHPEGFSADNYQLVFDASEVLYRIKDDNRYRRIIDEYSACIDYARCKVISNVP